MSRRQAPRATISPGVGFVIARSEDLEVQIGSSGDRWVFVEFRSAELPACTVMQPVFDELARTYREALFLRVDVDQVQGVQERFRIVMLPTYACFWAGAKETQFPGCSEMKLRQAVADCIELGPQVSFGEHGETKEQALKRLQELHSFSSERNRQKEMQRDLERQALERSRQQEQQAARQQAEAAFADVQSRFAEQRWTEEADRAKREAERQKREEEERQAEEARRQSEHLREAEEARVARLALDEAHKAMEDLQRQKDEDRRALAAQQEEAQAERERKEREIAELKAGLEQAKRDREWNESLHRHVQKSATQSYSESLKTQAARTNEEFARLQEETARLRLEAEGARSREDRLQAILRTEQGKNVAFDEGAARISVLRPFRFAKRYFGVERKDPPTAELLDAAGAEAVVQDIVEILKLHPGRAAQLVRIEPTQQIAENSKQKAKNEWEKALALSKTELVKQLLLRAGVPEARTSGQLRFGESEEWLVQLGPEPRSVAAVPPVAVRPHDHT